jgi:hypothetical protein
MRHVRGFFCIAGLLGAAGCGIDFTTQYDRIEERTVRPLAFVYDNHGFAEAAPGDTVTCRMYFAGEPVQSIRLTTTTSLVINSFGTDTFADTVSLDKYAVPGSYAEYFGGATDSAVIRFVVPADIISRQFSSDATIGSLLPPNIADSVLPEPLRSIKPSDLIALIESFGNGSTPAGAPPVLPALLPDSVAVALPAVFQALTVSMKLFATVNNRYRMESTFTIRYNSRFAAQLPTLPVNRPPEVNWVRCYRVRTGATLFDPVADSATIDSVFELSPGIQTVVIDTGYRYFLVADSAVASLDSGFSVTDRSSARRPEQLRYEWFFQYGDSVAGVPPDSLMTLDNGFGGPVIELLPSLDTRLSRFNLWLVTRDSFLGEKLRPVGFDILCIQGMFSYTDAYRSRHR